MQSTAVVINAIVLSAAGAVCAAGESVHQGTWPKSWPKELEPLRKQSQIREDTVSGRSIHEFRFHDRKDFESAWPHILKLKSKGAPVVLYRSPHKRVDESVAAGVRVLSPQASETPAEARGLARRMQTEIELVVDGRIVDLNRIPLPADTPIVDKRFTDEPRHRRVRLTAMALMGLWESNCGPVTIDLGAINRPEEKIPLTGSWLQGPDRKGIITRGVFDPLSGHLEFSFSEPWHAQTGTAEFHLSADGKTFTGVWRFTGGEVSKNKWIMTRSPNR